MESVKISKVIIGDNYRKTKTPQTKESMNELIESVKLKGILQPLLVRKKNGKFEVIVGGRRLEAAQKAGLKEVPVIIHKAGDAEALEISVIENTQREDPDLMDEVDGFKRLVELGKHTSETLAFKIGKSLKYVATRLKLADLPADIRKEIKKKMTAGEIGVGHAMLFTRLKNKADMKTFLEELYDGMTVSDAEDELRGFSTRMSDAPFDLKGCKVCPARTKNQTQLFPEIKDKDECMDSACFKGKTFDYYRSYYKQIEAQGFKVIRDDKGFLKLMSSKNALQIKDDKYHSDCRPNKYKSMCTKCKENHVFFFLIKKDNYGDKNVHHGECCLNKKCFDKMNKVSRPAKHDSGSSQSDNNYSYTKQAHIYGVRDRFLHAELTQRINSAAFERFPFSAPAEIKRLAIFHILDKSTIKWNDGFRMLLKENCTELKKGLYQAILSIPDKELMAVLTKTILLAIPSTDSDVLLQAAPEAGLDVLKSFRMDRDYLNTKTKAELLKFAKTLKLGGLEASMKKPEMLEAVLKHDLTGKVTPEIAESLELDYEDMADDLMLEDKDEE